MSKKQQFQTRCISALEKVFPDQPLTSQPLHRASALKNEQFSFQVAYCHEGELLKDLTIEIESELKDWIQLYSVELAPSEFTIYHDHDENILRREPGLYPDPLFPIEDVNLVAPPYQWRALWVTVDIAHECDARFYPIKLKFLLGDETLGEENFTLEVISAQLPEQKLIHTEWFHTDCLAVEYEVDVFSQKHWELIEQYIKTATTHGVNMIYTPLFTPPLDTEIGGERPTVQLVKVEKNKDEYQFDFTLLKEWVKLCQKNGIKYFEMSHLFTQWGAKHAPKIIVTENGNERQLFGWETEADGEQYQDFLNQFLPALLTFIEQEGIGKQVYFHLSDEPTLDNIESYKKANTIVEDHLQNYPVMDALSDYDFYEKGYVKKPIVANDAIDSFIEQGVDNLWTYYCCVQYKEVSNRFFIFPSARNRIIGYQLFKYDIEGFLQWGYNFWFKQFSKGSINPFTTTDADYGFPSGDAFLVYPGKKGPIESIRLKVFHDALQDLRALELLASKTSKEKVLELIEEDLEGELTFKNYPHEASWLLNKREQINKAIKEALS